MDGPALSTDSSIILLPAIEFEDGLNLCVRPSGNGALCFPTSRLAKGIVLCCGGRELVEEGLGFGVPLLKYGGLDVFPGSVRFTTCETLSEAVVTAEYELNTVKKLARKGKTLANRAVYSIEDTLGRLHRALPPARRPGNRIFDKIRNGLGLKTVFEEIGSCGRVKVRCTVNPVRGAIRVEADVSNIDRSGLTEIIIANEQGAGHFAAYRDSDGLAQEGERIGTWDEVKTASASFIDSRDGVAFTLQKIEGARLFRGRESEAGRLAWAGLNYILAPHLKYLAYDILLEKTR